MKLSEIIKKTYPGLDSEEIKERFSTLKAERPDLMESSDWEIVPTFEQGENTTIYNTDDDLYYDLFSQDFYTPDIASTEYKIHLLEWKPELIHDELGSFKKLSAVVIIDNEDNEDNEDNNTHKVVEITEEINKYDYINEEFIEIQITHDNVESFTRQNRLDAQLYWNFEKKEFITF
jgi:hypothetical protein